MMSAIFCFQPSVNRLFNSTCLHVCALYCHVNENIVKMRMPSRRDIVQLGNVVGGSVVTLTDRKL